MAEPQLFYIATSKAKEIRGSGSVTRYEWGNYSAWKKFKSPIKDSQKKVKYNKTSKNKIGASKLGGNGGVTKLGTSIPATATRTIAGYEVTVPVRYYQRGYTKFERTSSLKSQGKMSKEVYTKDKPYQYRLQYKDKPIYEREYSQYVDGLDHIYFADHYYDDDGNRVEREGFLPHPTEYAVGYMDIYRNQTSNANNSANRDNLGKYILSNVRSSVVTIKLKWEGLTKEQGRDLLDTLNPEKTTNGTYSYLTVQYMDPAKGSAVNKTFYASDREAVLMNNGCFSEISVTLMEV